MPPDATIPAPIQRQRLLHWIVDLLIVAGFVAVVCAPIIFSGASISPTPFFTDLFKLAQPTLVYTGERLRQGELPLWNPYWSGGYPNFATPSSGVFYPTTIFYGLLSFRTALNLIVLLHIYLAGAFSYCLGRRMAGGRAAGLFLAFAMVAGDLMLPMVQPGHPWCLQTWAWFPLVLLFAYESCARIRWRHLAGIAIASALMHLGGDAQSAAFALFYTGAFVTAELALRLIARDVTPRAVALRLAAMAAAVVLGAALAAIQIVPSQELLAESVRANGLTYAAFSGFIGSRWDLARAWLIGNYPSILAVGRISLLAALIGLVFSRSRTAWAAALAALPCLIYAFAPEWLFESVIRHVPVYGGIRAAARMTCMVYFTVALLGAFSIRAWKERTSGPDLARARILGLALALTLVGLLAPWLAGQPLNPALCGVVTAAAAVIAIGLMFRKNRRLFACVGIVLALAFGAEQILKTIDVGAFGNPSYTVNADLSVFSRERADRDRLEVFGTFEANPYFSAVGTLTKDRTVWGYHALYLTRYARLMDEIGGQNLAPRAADRRLEATNEIRPDWLTPPMLPLLDLFNVRYLLRLDKARLFAHLSAAQAARFQHRTSGKLEVFENTQVLPPAYAVHRVRVCKNDDGAIVLLHDGTLDYRNEITVTGPFDAASLAPASRPEPIVITQHAPERITATADLDTPAVVVFSEMYYPGWQAYVDGAPQTILIADVAFRGVPVGAGAHTIELRYEPRSLAVGAWISAASLALFAAITIATAVRSRRTRLTPA